MIVHQFLPPQPHLPVVNLSLYPVNDARNTLDDDRERGVCNSGASSCSTSLSCVVAMISAGLSGICFIRK